MKINFYLIAVIALSALAFSACPAPQDSNTGANEATENTAAENTASESSESAESEAAETDIVDGAVASKDHTTLVTAVKAADLVETLKGEGPFTVFAPTNAAFEKLPEGAVADLLKEENKDKLKGILTYHVVAGEFYAMAVIKAIEEGNGKATLKTVQGDELTASLDGDVVVLTDAKGGKSKVTKVDLKQKNGLIHVIDTVLMPGE